MLIERARLLVIHGEFERAQADYDAALDLARQVGDRGSEWEALEGLGLLWFGRDYNRAETYLHDALTLAREIGDKLMLARSLLQVGQSRANNNLAEAREALESARDLFIELGDRRGLADTINQLSMLVHMSTDAVAFADGVRQTADLFRELGNREGLSYALVVLSSARAHVFTRTLVASDEISFEEAVKANDEALAINREFGGWPMGDTWGLSIRAMVLHSAGRTGEALDLLSRAISISEQFDLTETICVGHLWTGLVYRDLCLDDLASERLQSGHAAALRGAAGYWIPVANSDLAESYVRAGDLDQASALLESVTPETPMTTFVDRHLWLASARLEIQRGNHEAATAIIDRLYETTGHVTSPRDIPALAEVRGVARMRAGQFDEALGDLDEALAGASDRAIPHDVWRIQARRAQALDHLGETAQAAAARAEARQIINEIAGGLPDNAIRSQFLTNAEAFIATGEAGAG
jgi:tetratricopeptide (TPR) repeat protein